MTSIDPPTDDNVITASSSDMAKLCGPCIPSIETSSRQMEILTQDVLDKLQQLENSMPHKEFEEACLLACLKRHNEVLRADPRSSCLYENDSLFCSETSDNDFWLYVIHDYRHAVARLPRLAAHMLRKGVPDPIRGDLWQSAVEGHDTHLKVLYKQQLLSGEHDSKNLSPFARELERDILQQQGEDPASKEPLIRILKAYSIYDDQVGYCPGLIHLVRILLVTMPEHSAFCTLVRLMQQREVRSLYTLNKAGLKLRLHQFEALLGKMYPDLESHLSKFSIQPSMYASQWYLSLFASALSTRTTLRVFDLVFLHGIDAITRVALAHVQRHKHHLLAMDRFETLLAFLASPEIKEDDEGLWEDALALCSQVTPERLEQIAATQNKELEQEKNRAQQVLNTRLPIVPLASNDRSAVTKLHQQIEDLVTALSHLQKEHSQLVQETATLKVRDVEHAKLVKRNAVLEKRVKKYKAKLARVTLDSEKKKEIVTPEDQHTCFVESLRLSGQFGTLVASALTNASPAKSSESTSTAASARMSARPATQHGYPTIQEKIEGDDDIAAKERLAEMTDKRRHSTEGLQEIASELVAIKLANFEMGQKYEQLCHKHEKATQQLHTMQGDQVELVEKLESLQRELEMHQIENDELLRENEELVEKALAAKKISDELQVEKIDLAKGIEKLELTIKELEEEKLEYLKPRDTFAEEVFAAHHVFFGPRTAAEAPIAAHRRHTLQPLPRERSIAAGGVSMEMNEYQAKYIESDLQCRELEKLLAETKLKLAEYESSSTCGSPRASLQRPYRPMSLQMKRQSTASLSILASRTPSSPHSRLSTDSFASSITSATSLGSSQRSSMYGRIWTALGSNQPAKHMQGDPLYEGPELAQTANDQ